MGVVSTDMSKAFDSLYPPLIVKKLEAYNFSESSLKLLRSYCNSRMNRAKIVSVTSTWKPLERGCPQGSNFGPLLWNIFQNDLIIIPYVVLSYLCMRTTTNYMEVEALLKR